jgi:TRAP-type C4-dicarboxylate transport system permease small subunit
MGEAGQVGAGAAYPERSQATTALVLGILGLVCCGILAPVAWYLGHQELEKIAAGRVSPENQGMAKAGQILGIIGTVILGLAVLGFLLFIPFGLLGAF